MHTLRLTFHAAFIVEFRIQHHRSPSARTLLSVWFGPGYKWAMKDSMPAVVVVVSANSEYPTGT